MPGRRSTKHRGKREGSIQEVRPGYFRGRLMLAGTRHNVHGHSREEVQAQFDDLRQRYRAGRPPRTGKDAPARERLDRYLRRWLAGIRGTMQPKSWTNHERGVNLHLVPAIGHLALSELAAQHLRELYGRLQTSAGTGMKANGLAPRTVRYIHTTIRQALDQAVADGVLDVNVARSVKPPKVRRRPPEILHADDLARFWAVADGDRLRALWYLLSYTALRSGEALGCQWPDVDLVAGTLTVRQDLDRISDGEPVFDAPKSAAGVRSFELAAEVVDELAAHRARQQQERERAGLEWREHGLVFATRRGTPLRNTNVLRRFRQVLRAAGLPTSLPVKNLRHTAISHQLAAGVPLPEVSRNAGHASPAVTTQLYAAYTRAGRSAQRRLGDYYRRATGRDFNSGDTSGVRAADEHATDD